MLEAINRIERGHHPVAAGPAYLPALMLGNGDAALSFLAESKGDASDMQAAALKGERVDQAFDFRTDAALVGFVHRGRMP